jgi:hypothetical protein
VPHGSTVEGSQTEGLVGRCRRVGSASPATRVAAAGLAHSTTRSAVGPDAAAELPFCHSLCHEEVAKSHQYAIWPRSEWFFGSGNHGAGSFTDAWNITVRSRMMASRDHMVDYSIRRCLESMLKRLLFRQRAGYALFMARTGEECSGPAA